MKRKILTLIILVAFVGLQPAALAYERNFPAGSIIIPMDAFYQPDDDGTITVPFSARPMRQPIVLSHDGLSCLNHFQHESENYTLEAGIYVDRESLLKRKQAHVVVRPSLKLNGIPVTLSVLDDVVLSIHSTDLDGVSSSKEVDDFELHENHESTYEFQVPQRLSKISEVPLEPGMILSNEPGYYRDGAFGIRIENLIVVTQAVRPDGGDDRDMLCFETLTYVPIERRLIKAEMLSRDERDWLNGYHAKTEALLSPQLSPAARDWLRDACAPI